MGLVPGDKMDCKPVSLNGGGEEGESPAVYWAEAIESIAVPVRLA